MPVQIAFEFADNEFPAQSKIVLLKMQLSPILPKIKSEKGHHHGTHSKINITCRYQAPHASIYNGNTRFPSCQALM
jgi:hypothetical protein